MPVIADHLGQRVIPVEGNEVLPAGNIGIEIELEGNANGRWPNVEGWDLKPDGSLRDGMEYVFDGPQSGDNALGSINDLDQAMAIFRPEPTFRCSTHIHVDVRDLSWEQYERLVLLYMIYEDALFDHAQAYRRQSNFCIPFMANDWLAEKFGREIIGRADANHKFMGAQHWPKYSALNLQTTSSFGTVEFRGMHAVFTRDELLALAQRMLHIKRFAKVSQAANHFDFITEAREAGLRGVFIEGLNDGYEMMEGALEQGVSSAMHSLMVASRPQPQAFHNWNAPPEPIRATADNPNASTMRTMRGTSVLGRRVTWNQGGLRDLNIMSAANNPTLENALKLLDALNRLGGVDIRLRDIVVDYRDLAPAIHWLNEGNKIQLMNNHLGTILTHRQI